MKLFLLITVISIVAIQGSILISDKLRYNQVDSDKQSQEQQKQGLDLLTEQEKEIARQKALHSQSVLPQAIQTNNDPNMNNGTLQASNAYQVESAIKTITVQEYTEDDCD